MVFCHAKVLAYFLEEMQSSQDLQRVHHLPAALW